MEDNAHVTFHPDLPFRTMNFSLPSARKLSIVLLVTFALFAALASTSSFETIPAFATSAIELATFALEFVPSPGKASIQISNVTFNYVASVADGGKTTMGCRTWVCNIFPVVAWVTISIFLTFALGIVSCLMLVMLCGGVEKMKTLGRVAFLVSIHTLRYRADSLWVGKGISTRVTSFEEGIGLRFTRVAVTVTTVETME